MTDSAHGKPRIVCASSVTDGRNLLERIGEVVEADEAEISRATVARADVLVTRSKVKVGASLLEGTPVRFYGTATAGYDHVDTGWLEQNGIAWTHAPGCNANSVAEYVVAALLYIARSRSEALEGRTLGIIGAGHVGSRMAALAKVLGMKILLNDPPLHDQTGSDEYRPISEVLAAADVVTLHVPLEDKTRYPTRGMVDESFLKTIKPGVWLINASRGEVINEPDLLASLRNGHPAALVLDVFDHEPDPDPALMECCDLVSPHIAGYSHDGKCRGTRMVSEKVCAFLNAGTKAAALDHELPPAGTIRLDPQARLSIETLELVVRQVYDITEDDRSLRKALTMDSEARAAHFSALRKHYRCRREFPAWLVEAQGADPNLIRTLKELGFRVKIA